MHLFPIKIILLQYLTTIKSDMPTNADILFTAWPTKLQILSSCRKFAWDASAPLFRSLKFSCASRGAAPSQHGSFLEVQHDPNEIWLWEKFSRSLATYNAYSLNTISSLMPTGKSKALSNSLKVQKALCCQWPLQSACKAPDFTHLLPLSSYSTTC